MIIRCVRRYLADASHPGHVGLGVAIQLHGSLGKEEVDLVVVALFTAAALPHQGWAHKVRLCTCNTQSESDIYMETRRQPHPPGLNHNKNRCKHKSLTPLFHSLTPLLTSLSTFCHRSSSSQPFFTLCVSTFLLTVHFLRARVCVCVHACVRVCFYFL